MAAKSDNESVLLGEVMLGPDNVQHWLRWTTSCFQGLLLCSLCGSKGPHQPLLSMDVHKDPLESMSYAVLGGFVNLKDPTLLFFSIHRPIIYTHIPGLNTFPVPVICTWKEKKKKKKPHTSEGNFD